LNKGALNQRGRPDGFTGLVLESSKGVPILIGPRTFSDALLRRIARGTDLWFQVINHLFILFIIDLFVRGTDLWLQVIKHSMNIVAIFIIRFYSIFIICFILV
jgi:hypothetical protein